VPHDASRLQALPSLPTLRRDPSPSVARTIHGQGDRSLLRWRNQTPARSVRVPLDPLQLKELYMRQPGPARLTGALSTRMPTPNTA